jgi:hypothetical protein
VTYPHSNRIHISYKYGFFIDALIPGRYNKYSAAGPADTGGADTPLCRKVDRMPLHGLASVTIGVRPHQKEVPNA